MEKNVYVYVMDTLSDWEPGFTTAELNSGRYFKNKGERIPVKMVSATNDPIVTMGGMKIVPDLTVQEMTAESTAMLMLIGADTWDDPKHAPILEKTKEFLDAGINVAAICGATGALAKAGLLDNRPHTSNAPEYLKMVAPDYKGEAHYIEERVVVDNNLITAGSSDPLPYARSIIEKLDVFSSEVLEAWYKYYETGDSKYFFALMQALPQ